MPGLIDTLYFYSEEQKVPFLLETPEYRGMVRRLEQDWLVFRSGLSIGLDLAGL